VTDLGFSKTSACDPLCVSSRFFVAISSDIRRFFFLRHSLFKIHLFLPWA
jgi:hypothetical protein